MKVGVAVGSPDPRPPGGRMLKDLLDLEQKADKLEAEIRSVMKERGGI